MVAIINGLYLIIILFFLLAAFFICYHIIKYSLSKMEMLITLAIFLSVFLVLILSNIAIFSSLRLDQVMGIINN